MTHDVYAYEMPACRQASAATIVRNEKLTISLHPMGILLLVLEIFFFFQKLKNLKKKSEKLKILKKKKMDCA